MNPLIPALRIALTSQCNLSCSYCPPNGENYLVAGKPLPIARLLRIFHILYEIGFRNFGFTGGEPLVSSRLVYAIKECLKLRGVYLKLYTNGVLLKDKIGLAREFDMVKLSLDTLDRKLYKRITGKDYLLDVLQAIELARKKGIKIRINTVLNRNNYGEIPNIIDYCLKKEIDMKILDLNCFAVPGYSVWRDLYRSPAGIAHYLEKKGLRKKTIYTTGNYGIPMSEYKWDKIGIRIKDTNYESIYAPVCRHCKYFLCQEGLYHLTLTCDGRLKICRHRPDISVDISSQNSKNDIARRIENFLNEHYFPARRRQDRKQVFLGQFGGTRFPS